MKFQRATRLLAPSLLALAGALPLAAPAQTPDSAFSTGLKGGERVTVDIAGYKYQAKFRNYEECRDGGKCARITDDDGITKSVLLRYLKPPVAGAEQKAAANLGNKPAIGKYTCSAFSGYLISIPGFTLTDGTRFKDHVGTGSWTWDAGKRTVSMKGGAWNGQRLQTTSNGSLQVLKADGSQGATTCSKSS